MGLVQRARTRLGPGRLCGRLLHKRCRSPIRHKRCHSSIRQGANTFNTLSPHTASYLWCCAHVPAGVKAFRDTQELLQHDFSSDASIADKAVTTLKEEIRERNAAITKVTACCSL